MLVNDGDSRLQLRPRVDEIDLHFFERTHRGEDWDEDDRATFIDDQYSGRDPFREFREDAA